MKYTNSEQTTVFVIALLIAIVVAGVIGFLVGYNYALISNHL
jgi:hypothetical protein